MRTKVSFLRKDTLMCNVENCVVYNYISSTQPYPVPLRSPQKNPKKNKEKQIHVTFFKGLLLLKQK